MRMLLQFEPDADEDFTMYVSPESEAGKPRDNWACLGQHNALKLSWISKNYNKLGSYLHVKMGNKSVRESKDVLSRIRKDVERIVAELEPAVNSDLVGTTFSPRVQFKCQVCDQLSVANTDVLRRTRRATCISPQCGAEYSAAEDAGGWQFELAMRSFKCKKCEKTNFLEIQHVGVGQKFRCRHCGEVHRIVGGQWNYERITDKRAS